MKSESDIKILKKFKEKYQLTWPEVSKVLGRSLSAIEHWSADKKMPLAYKRLVEIYTDYPQIFAKYKEKK